MFVCRYNYLFLQSISNQNITIMSSIKISNVEVDFPALSHEQLADYVNHVGLLDIPASVCFIAWRSDLYEGSVFLHEFILRLSQLGFLQYPMVFEGGRDLDIKWDARQIVLCYGADSQVLTTLGKLLQAYCGDNWLLFHPFYVAKGMSDVKKIGGRS